MAITDRKRVSFGREPFNGYTHLISAAAAMVGGIVLVEQAQGRPLLVIACVIYGVSLFLAFFSSALFHLVSGSPEMNRRLRDFDHHCISGLIMGTYAPFAVLMLPAAWAMACLVYLVSVATVNAVVSSRRRGKISRTQLAAWYTGLATLSLFSVPFCWADFWQPILWISFGSLFYIMGAICYVKKIPKQKRWFNFHEVWHISVMVGAFVHYMVILWLV